MGSGRHQSYNRRTEYLNVTLQGAQRSASPVIFTHKGLASKGEWDVCGS